MKEIEAIRRHPLFVDAYQKIKQLETDRVFCRHQMPHLLDVARVAYLLDLEEGLGIRREVVYAAALLHDIGKYRQYTEDIPHERASAEIARQILNDLPREMFSEEEKAEILRAIRGHRRLRPDMEGLERILCVADKRSRLCFECEAADLCDWEQEKKNQEIEL